MIVIQLAKLKTNYKKNNKTQQSSWARQKLYKSICQQPKQYENTGQHSDGIMWTKSAYKAINSVQWLLQKLSIPRIWTFRSFGNDFYLLTCCMDNYDSAGSIQNITLKNSTTL